MKVTSWLREAKYKGYWFEPLKKAWNEVREKDRRQAYKSQSFRLYNIYK